MQNFKAGNEDEWGTVVKAQDEIGRRIESEERSKKKQARSRYKEDLDMQLSQKYDGVNEQASNREVISYYKAQMKAIKEFEAKQKQEERNYYRFFQNNNSAVIETKVKEQQLSYNKERINENIRIQKELQAIEREKQAEASKKQQRINEERLEYQRQMNEKLIKDQVTNIEKQRERELIVQNVQKMKELEASHQEVKTKQLNLFEEKMKKISPVPNSNINKDQLISKWFNEWQTKNSVKIAQKEQSEKESRDDAIRKLRVDLKSQMEVKSRFRRQEQEEGLKYKRLAQIEAKNEEAKLMIMRMQKLTEEVQIRNDNERLLQEKRSSSMARLRMDSREKSMNNEILSKLQSREAIPFPGIPGIHSLESPIKSSYQRNYSNNRLTTGKSLEKSYDKINVSIEKSHLINPQSFNDLSRHNPITNPLGSALPRVLPGQRLYRGFKSQPRFANVTKDIYSNF